MILEDFHVHSSFSDGAAPPEEVVRAALERGMKRLGFSDHGYAVYDSECCVPREKLKEHRETVAALKEKYRGQIEIFCGVEQDFYSDAPTEDYDYVIGSVHYLYLGGRYYDIDYRVETLRELADTFFAGDLMAVAEEYFRTVGQVWEKTRCHIIGHLDLISKLNERYRLFDTAHPRYIAAWKAAADRLLPRNVPFEINTGAMSRGYRRSPYPARDILLYLRDRGARFLLSSDSHSPDTLCYDFPAQAAEAERLGLRLEAFQIPGRS